MKFGRAFSTLAAAALLIACVPASESSDEAGSEMGSETQATGTETETDTGAESETTSENSCASSEECAADERCDFPDGLCGVGQLGECVPRPESCVESGYKVCACDGNSYFPGCEAVAGVDGTLGPGKCEVPQGSHLCGKVFCPNDTHYCERSILDGEDPAPDIYACRVLPEACVGSQDCACLAEVNCGNYCELIDGHFLVTCPGG